MKETGRVQPLRYENIAVLFYDIVDFTAFCEELPPEQVIAHLQEMVSELEIIAQRHDLQKIKTIDDAFMATCGLLIRPENPVLNCVRAGVDMVQGVPQLNAAWKVRVGIHVGPVVAGV